MRATSKLGVCFVLLVSEFGLTSAQPADLPLIAQDSDGPCRMSVRGGGNYFAIEVSGLVRSEELVVTSASEGEVISRVTKAGPDGTYTAVDIPLVQGKSSGRGTFTVKGSRCEVRASYPWRE